MKRVGPNAGGPSEGRARLPAAREPFWDPVPALVWFAALGVTLFAYPRLPAQLPFHWGPPGEPDVWVPRLVAAAAGLVAAALTYVATWLNPDLVGGGRDYGGPASPHRLIRRALVFVFLILQATELAAGLGASGRRLLPLAIGLAFIALGNVFGLVPPNRWLGTRTTATLADGRVWHRTHRFTAYLLVGLGLVMVAGAALGEWAFFTLLASLILAPLGSFGYAAVIARRATGKPRR